MDKDLESFFAADVCGVVRESRELTKQEELQFPAMVLKAKRKEIVTL